MKRKFLLFAFLLLAVNLNAQIKVERLDKLGLEKICKRAERKSSALKYLGYMVRSLQRRISGLSKSC